MSDRTDAPYDPPQVDEIQTDLPVATAPGEALPGTTS